MFKELKEWFTLQYNSIWNTLHFKRKVKEANEMHKRTGKQYHVIPGPRKELLIVNNEWLKKFNKAIKKGGGKPISFPQLLEMSYYSTPIDGMTRQKYRESLKKKKLSLFKKIF